MEQRSATYYVFTVLPPAGREALRVLFRDLPADILPVIQIGVFRHLSACGGTASLWPYKHEPDRQEDRR
jgi:hypothetical protein